MIHLCGYVYDNPSSFVDPNGLGFWSDYWNDYTCYLTRRCRTDDLLQVVSDTGVVMTAIGVGGLTGGAIGGGVGIGLGSVGVSSGTAGMVGAVTGGWAGGHVGGTIGSVVGDTGAIIGGIGGGLGGGGVAWGELGLPTYGIAISRQAVGYGLNVTYQVGGIWIRGTGTGPVRLPVGPGWGGFSPGWWNSFTGIPILNPGVAAGGAGDAQLWFPNHPCASHAIQGFVNGWIRPY